MEKDAWLREIQAVRMHIYYIPSPSGAEALEIYMYFPIKGEQGLPKYIKACDCRSMSDSQMIILDSCFRSRQDTN